MTSRACDCQACRTRNESDYWRIVEANYSVADEASAEAYAETRARETAEAIALARGEEDGA